MKFITLIKNNGLIIMLGFCVIAAASTLMVVSQEVYERQKKVNKLSGEVLQAQWDIKSLNAELSYLSRPERVEQIATAMDQANENNFLHVESKVIEPVSLNLTASIMPIQKPIIKAAAKKQTNLRQSELLKPRNSETPKSQTPNFATLLDSIGGAE